MIKLCHLISNSINQCLIAFKLIKKENAGNANELTQNSQTNFEIQNINSLGTNQIKNYDATREDSVQNKLISLHNFRNEANTF
jgi:hypothetical protein